MKLRVQRKQDDKIEVLDLQGPMSDWSPERNPETGYVFQLRHFTCGGVDRYFDLDGYYDGWGAAVRTDAQGAGEITAAMEEKRDIED